jgi:dTDP-glucose 4,6-dehydratase
VALKILVTGGAGFIGSNFVRYFLRAHPESAVLNLDKLTYAGNLDNLAEVESPANYQFVRGDIGDTSLVESLLDQQVAAIIHFAAESHVDRSIADARAFVQTNVLGTYTLLEAARRARIPRFVHVSTDEVYGSLGPGEAANEQAPLRPNSPYAASKAAADLLVRSFWQTYHFPAIITRSSNNYGPNQFPEKLIPLMITNAVEGKKLPLYGDGLNERDWIFVADHCRALDRILEAGQPGEIYNIGFGRPVTNLEIVRRLLGVLGKSEDLIDFVVDRPGHDRRYALDTNKIHGELGWEPAVGLEEGLTQTVQWYRTHLGWVEKTKSGEYRAYYEKFYENRRASLASL